MTDVRLPGDYRRKSLSDFSLKNHWNHSLKLTRSSLGTRWNPNLSKYVFIVISSGRTRELKTIDRKLPFTPWEYSRGALHLSFAVDIVSHTTILLYVTRLGANSSFFI